MKTSVRNVVKSHILSVLTSHSRIQPNLTSEACREAIANSIVSEINKHFSFSVKPFSPLDYTIDMEADDEFGN